LIRTAIIFLLSLTIAFNSFCQDSTGVNKKRLKSVIITESVMYVGIMAGLSTQWYSENEQSSFHFFNDNRQWLQMDKLGHLASAYQTGKMGIDVLKWSGVENKKAAYFGGALGLAFLSGVEVLDGFSSEWGFSWGDMAANTLGASLAISQELLFKKQIAIVKFSYHSTEFPDYRPEVLGESRGSSILKDYNGQTYWLSLNLKDITGVSAMPEWLSVSGGYSATGMFGGSNNPAFSSSGTAIPLVKRYRQYYLSLDIDLERIPTKSKVLKTAFKALNFIKIPMPTLRFQDGKGVTFYPIYF